MVNITFNVERLLKALPHHVTIVAAAKSRTPAEVRQAIQAGITIIGENFIQETAVAKEVIKDKAHWHFIGHLQSNKVGKAVQLFDMIETLDSAKLAQAVNKHCLFLNKTMPVLIEVNIGEESQKYGVAPQEVVSFVEEISPLNGIEVMGLMTVGPQCDNPNDLIPYYRRTRRLFDEIDTLNLKNVCMKYLSMGMSDSYQQAIAEGANMVRIGSAIFGPRR